VKVNQNQEHDLALLEQIRLGDTHGKEEMILKYLPMVKHIARRHYAPFLEFEDLMQEGFIGLLSAIDEYNSDYDIKFSSFAYICIIRKVYNVIKQCNGNKHKALNKALSFQAAVAGNDTRTILDLIPDDNASSDPVHIIETQTTNQDIDELLNAHLSLLEYSVVHLLLQGYACTEIERALGVKAKVVDNARTRVKMKLRRLLQMYGSLLSPHIPTKVRHRTDLYLDLKLGS
jgi:RNA polymerase sporulation-specific sigma factor